MSLDKWIIVLRDIMLAMFTLYLFFIYFNIFFKRKKIGISVLIGIITLFVWQFCIPYIIYTLPSVLNIVITLGFTIFASIHIFQGKVWMKGLFSIIFDTIWMLIETLIGNLLMICNISIEDLHFWGSFTSKLFFLIIIIALKKVFTNEKVMELPLKHSFFIVLIPIGNIHIMNTVFILAYRSDWRYAAIYSLFSVIILLFINVFIFYIYIKMVDDLQIRRMNLVYERQLELCARHQEETELSITQMRYLRHSMKNHFISILAYAEKGECERIKKFVNDIMEEGMLKSCETANTGNIVIDSLVGYWQKIAENKGIEFFKELMIPIDMPFKGADISLILGNLLENAIEGAEKAQNIKYIRLSIKYNKNNLLIVVENTYKGELIRGKRKELKTTKIDATNHGIGLPSIQKVAMKYHGGVYIDDTINGHFFIRVVLYGN